MAFDKKDRDELCEVFDDIAESVRKCLTEHRVLPSSITMNRERVGITVQFRKLSNTESEPPDPPEDPEENSREVSIQVQMQMMRDTHEDYRKMDEEELRARAIEILDEDIPF